MSVRTMSIVACLCLLSLVRAVASPGAQGGPAENAEVPEIRSPRDGERIGEGEVAECPDAPEPCYRVRATGWVPPKHQPFFAVGPVTESPKLWVQPRIHGVRSDGAFSTLIYLGEAHNGAGEYFNVYLFACEDEDRYAEGRQITALPENCLVSEPIEVFRVR